MHKLCNHLKYYDSKKMADDYSSSNSRSVSQASAQGEVVRKEINPHDYRCWEMFKAYRQCICELTCIPYVAACVGRTQPFEFHVEMGRMRTLTRTWHYVCEILVRRPCRGCLYASIPKPSSSETLLHVSRSLLHVSRSLLRHNEGHGLVGI